MRQYKTENEHLRGSLRPDRRRRRRRRFGEDAMSTIGPGKQDVRQRFFFGWNYTKEQPLGLCGERNPLLHSIMTMDDVC